MIFFIIGLIMMFAGLAGMFIIVCKQNKIIKAHKDEMKNIDRAIDEVGEELQQELDTLR